MYAIIQTGGKQYRVTEGDEIYVEKLDKFEGEEIEFTEVLAIEDGKKIKTGKPFVKDAVVKATVVKNGKNKKIVVFTYKSKKNEKTKAGHRQPYTKVKIGTIAG